MRCRLFSARDVRLDVPVPAQGTFCAPLAMAIDTDCAGEPASAAADEGGGETLLDAALLLAEELRVAAIGALDSPYAALRYAHVMFELNACVSRCQCTVLRCTPRLCWRARTGVGDVCGTNSLLLEELMAHLHAVSTCLSALARQDDAALRPVLRRVAVWQANEARRVWASAEACVTCIEWPRATYTRAAFGQMLAALPDVLCVALAVEEYDRHAAGVNGATSAAEYGTRGRHAYDAHRLSPGSMLWTLATPEIRARIDTIAAFTGAADLHARLATASARAFATTLLVLAAVNDEQAMTAQDRAGYLASAICACEDHDVRYALAAAAALEPRALTRRRRRHLDALQQLEQRPARAVVVLSHQVAPMTTAELCDLLRVPGELAPPPDCAAGADTPPVATQAVATQTDAAPPPPSRQRE